MPSSNQVLREYLAAYGCARALAVATVAVTVAVRDTEQSLVPTMSGDLAVATRQLYCGHLAPRTGNGALSPIWTIRSAIAEMPTS